MKQRNMISPCGVCNILQLVGGMEGQVRLLLCVVIIGVSHGRLSGFKISESLFLPSKYIHPSWPVYKSMASRSLRGKEEGFAQPDVSAIFSHGRVEWVVCCFSHFLWLAGRKKTGGRVTSKT